MARQLAIKIFTSRYQPSAWRYNVRYHVALLAVGTRKLGRGSLWRRCHNSKLTRYTPDGSCYIKIVWINICDTMRNCDTLSRISNNWPSNATIISYNTFLTFNDNGWTSQPSSCSFSCEKANGFPSRKVSHHCMSTMTQYYRASIGMFPRTIKCIH